MTLYLHIGAQKTGSTTIQAALAQSRDLLREFGLNYPESEPDDLEKASHYNCFRGYFSQRQDQAELTGRFVSRVNDLPGDVLLSSEALSNWPAYRSSDTAATYLARKHACLAAMRADLAATDIKVILCIRERRSYLKSLFKQHLKIQRRVSLSIESELASFLAQELPRSDMRKQIPLWEALFGKVRVIDFDRHAADGSLLPAFVSALDRHFELPAAGVRNISPDWTALELRRLSVSLGIDAALEADSEKAFEFNRKVEDIVDRTIAAALKAETPH